MPIMPLPTLTFVGISLCRMYYRLAWHHKGCYGASLNCSIFWRMRIARPKGTDPANFSELRLAAVQLRRILLPRTSVNKEEGKTKRLPNGPTP